MQVQINFIAVLVATGAALLINYLWYHPRILGSNWSRLAKVKHKDIDISWAAVTAILSAFVMALVLAFFAYIYDYFFMGNHLINVVTTALIIWFGFQAVRAVQRDALNQRRKKETLIHVAHDLVVILVMGVVIGLFGV